MGSDLKGQYRQWSTKRESMESDIPFLLSVFPFDKVAAPARLHDDKKARC